jgi:hypothetical protein
MNWNMEGEWLVLTVERQMRQKNAEIRRLEHEALHPPARVVSWQHKVRCWVGQQMIVFGYWLGNVPIKT